MTVPSGTSNCTSSCGTVYEGTPLLNLGFNPPLAAQYRTQLEGLSVDCAWALGCIPFLNNGSEEDSWFRNVNFMGYGGEAIRLTEYTTAGFLSGGTTGGGASQSGPYTDFSINFLSETCEQTSTGCGASTGSGHNNPVYFGFDGKVNTQNAATGGCAANCVTDASSTAPFNTNWTGTIYLDTAGTGTLVAYTISSVQSSSVLTVGSAPGTHSGIAWTLGTAYGTNPQNINPLGCFTTGILIDGPRSSGGTTTVNHLDKISAFTISASDNNPSNTFNPNTPVAMSDAACGTPYTSHTTPIGIETWGVMADIENFHIEDYPAEIQIGGNAALNAAYPGTTVGLNSQSTVTTNGVRISNGATSSGSSNAWEVDIGANAGDIELGKLTRFGGQRLFNDNVTGNQCTDKTLGAYFLGNGTNPNVFTTCNGITQQFDGPLFQPGVAFSSLPGSPPVGTLQFCTNCIPTTAASCSTASPASCVCASGTGSMWAKYENFVNHGAGWYCH